MSKFVLLITGPAGSGKSTIGKALSKEIPNTVHIDADEVKHFIVNGFLYDKSKKGMAQWKLLGHNLGLLAYNYNKANFNVIINGYLSVEAFERLAKLIKPTHKVLLLPHLKAAISRDAKRKDEVKMGRHAVAKHHEHLSSDPYFNDWHTIDSTIHGVHDTKTDIQKLLKKTKKS